MREEARRTRSRGWKKRGAWLVLLSMAALLSTHPWACGGKGKTTPEFREARRNGRQANEAFTRSHRFLHGWLKFVDPATGLFPRNLNDFDEWNVWSPCDNAADNYPFMVLTAFFTDRSLLEGSLLDILRAETKLTSRLDRIPDTYSLGKEDWRYEEPNIERIIFNGSEYVKDGLLYITEWMGRENPWTERMLGILDDIWKHAPIDTKSGKIPSTSTEVNGEQLQTLTRVYWMTGDRKYYEWALRLADYYFFEKHLTRDFKRLNLRDHGCETVSGLSEIYATTHFVDPERQKLYQAPIHEIYDRILEIGRNEHGMLYEEVDLRTGKPTVRNLSDNWGYDYNGFYAVYLVDGTERYREAVRHALGNLDGHYRNHIWHRYFTLADGYADSIEGALTLYNRERIPSVAKWIDSEIEILFGIQKPDGVVEGMHHDGNFARTALMYALWKTKGLTIHPWRADVRLGAVQDGDTLYVSVSAEKPWKGRLVFDKPRGKINMKLPLDYPRINQFPEWFTVDSTERASVSKGTDRSPKTYSGAELWEGVPVDLGSGEEMLLAVEKL